MARSTSGATSDRLVACRVERSRLNPAGAALAFALALACCLAVRDSFQGLVWSQALLSLQLPLTIFLQIWLTSSRKVMGRYANSRPLTATLVVIGIIVTLLDLMLLAG